ncbi:MAG: Peptidyl-prolyl cis-trans isomerase [Candidatus Nomurabacteria bacterium GW2011_GWA2_40_9]|uniref:Peptidyl-prolyl cis-trans isomerase n=1 Tax=Candidatus Nomurabacteria bacterium GW2011_GWA2_40_9 TaxID=1618734 RepID=A0A0G0TVN5_9BACT|nr:MAG: Peptidyl-prolyl cis-trans isomerase [Candidatus Nomurabacteria bacterium GW2011_GWA2_40_9]
MENKKKMVVWILVVLLVVGALVFITIKKGNNNLGNTQKVEGVDVTILSEGSGEEAKIGDSVSMNYTGTLEDGTAFDSNVDPKFNHVSPFLFNLGAGQVIKGWDIGVVGMKVGEKRRLEINAEFAYGEAGVGSIIPPNAKLIFDVELVAIVK